MPIISEIPKSYVGHRVDKMQYSNSMKNMDVYVQKCLGKSLSDFIKHIILFIIEPNDSNNSAFNWKLNDAMFKSMKVQIQEFMKFGKFQKTAHDDLNKHVLSDYDDPN